MSPDCEVFSLKHHIWGKVFKGVGHKSTYVDGWFNPLTKLIREPSLDINMTDLYQKTSGIIRLSLAYHATNNDMT